jgi:hypothetical protein
MNTLAKSNLQNLSSLPSDGRGCDRVQRVQPVLLDRPSELEGYLASVCVEPGTLERLYPLDQSPPQVELS